MTTAKIIVLAIAISVADSQTCIDEVPPVAEAQTPTSPPPIVLKSICDYERGKLCDSTCPGGAGCALADEGWLCCNDAGSCLPVAVDTVCSSSQGNIKGHCDDYTVDAVGNATCHDT